MRQYIGILFVLVGIAIAACAPDAHAQTAAQASSTAQPADRVKPTSPPAIHVVVTSSAASGTAVDDILITLGKELVWPLTCGLLLFTAIGAVISYIATRQAASTARVNLLATCQKSYSDIATELFDLNNLYQTEKLQQTHPAGWSEGIRFKARKAMARLWSLQHAQFLYFEEGLVTPRIYRSWLRFRHKEFRSQTQYDFEGVTFRNTWQEYIVATNLHETSRFRKMMETAMETGKPDEAGDAHAAARQAVDDFLRYGHPSLWVRMKACLSH
jgi:hypothetical protein